MEQDVGDPLPSAPAPSPPPVETKTEWERETETEMPTDTETPTETPTATVTRASQEMSTEPSTEMEINVEPSPRHLRSQAGPSTSPCVVCERRTRLQCSQCGISCHDVVPCGGRIAENVVCAICEQDRRASSHRREAAENLQKQAKKMLKASARMDTTPLASGTNVRVGLSFLDQARNQPPNVIAVVLSVSLTPIA